MPGVARIWRFAGWAAQDIVVGESHEPRRPRCPSRPNSSPRSMPFGPSPRMTLRTVSEGMEAHLYKAWPVLDHGFVRVIDYMGDDAAICQAARVSYGRGTKSRAERRGADPLPHAALAFDPVRDVRGQAAREAARLRGPPMDPAPHRQRERVFGPVLDPRPGILHPRAVAAGRAIGHQQPGPGRGADGRRGGARAGIPQGRCGAPTTITKK